MNDSFTSQRKSNRRFAVYAYMSWQPPRTTTMGVNLFMIREAPVDDTNVLDNIANQRIYTRGRYSWAALFEGGQNQLTVDEAKAFGDDEMPWYIIDKDGNITDLNPEDKGWRKWLDILADRDDVIYFLKARN